MYTAGKILTRYHLKTAKPIQQKPSLSKPLYFAGYHLAPTILSFKDLKMNNIIISGIMLVLIFGSCTKEIKVDLKSTEPKIVIEGNITNESGPYTVQIGKTVNFFDPNQLPPVSGALVIISDNGGVIDTLTETSPGVYKTAVLAGIPGRTYNLKVGAEGKNFNAISTTQQVVNLDSLAFDLFTNHGNSGGKNTLHCRYLQTPLMP
jgi:hypothetical protein